MKRSEDSPLLGAIAAVLVAGRERVGASAAPGASQQVVIGYINHIDSIPFIQLVRKGIQAGGSESRGEGAACATRTATRRRPSQCAAQFKAQKVDGIINFQPVEAAGPRRCAAGPKVPVIAIDIHQRPCETVFYGAEQRRRRQAGGRGARAVTKAESSTARSTRGSPMEAPAVGVVNNQRLGRIPHGYKSVCRYAAQHHAGRREGHATDPPIQPARDTLTRLTGKHRILVVEPERRPWRSA
jgi:ribose transport system substrate-binding protein